MFHYPNARDPCSLGYSTRPCHLSARHHFANHPHPSINSQSCDACPNRSHQRQQFSPALHCLLWGLRTRPSPLSTSADRTDSDSKFSSYIRSDCFCKLLINPTLSSQMKITLFPYASPITRYLSGLTPMKYLGITAIKRLVPHFWLYGLSRQCRYRSRSRLSTSQ